MEASETNAAARLAEPKARSHLAIFHRTPQQWRQAVLPFMAGGLRRNERVIYVASVHGPLQICDLLMRENLDVSRAMDNGQLIVLEADRVFLREGFFDPDRVLGKFIASAEQAISAGFKGLRATVEMAWASYRPLDHQRLLEFERRLHRDFFPHYECIALCQYDQALFPPDLLRQLEQIHDLL